MKRRFFDHTAHNYLRGICDDLAMKYIGAYPAEMYDLVRRREGERFRKAMDRQLVFLLSGPLGQLPNLVEILTTYAQFQQANLAGMVTDEVGDSDRLDALLREAARRALARAELGYRMPPDYRGVGGMKIFRDEVWGKRRFVFQADHRYYKRHGYYDFPQKDFKTRRRNLLMMTLTKIPAFRRRFLTLLEMEMVKPLKQVVERAGGQQHR
ncbi:MAG: hypothetical protein N2Z74_01545 [Syntrophales bacterium]|nr:hypothetical protein [Syntrophales bacterium]